MTKPLSALAILISASLLGGCAENSRVSVRKNNPIGRLQRVVVLPFTDDPFVPASGLKAAEFFTKEAQLKLKNVEWIGPRAVLKQEGFVVAAAADEDTPLDMPGAVEPVLGQIFRSTETVPVINPKREREIAKHYNAEGVVRGSVFYDPGTGMVESMVTEKRPPQAALSIQMTDATSGEVFLAFNQDPQSQSGHPTANELLRKSAESAVTKIERSWR